jgi:hypothetical protein
MSEEKIIGELQMTNVQPLVLTGAAAGHAPVLARIGERVGKLPRSLVLTGDDGVPLPAAIQKIDTRIDIYDLADLAGLPWETLGAVVVRRYMRREALV